MKGWMLAYKKAGERKIMSEAIRAILKTVLKGYDALAAKNFFLDKGAETIKKYFKLLFFLFVISFVPSLPLIYYGIFHNSNWALVMGGMWRATCTLLLMLAATPIGVIFEIATGGIEDSGKRYVGLVSGLFISELLFTLIVSIIPIANNSKALPVFVLASLLFGILCAMSMNEKLVYTFVGLVLIGIILSFYFPNSFNAFKNRIEGIDLLALRPNPIRHTLDEYKSGKVEFFYPNGKPKVWYVELDDNKIELVDKAGTHSGVGERSKEITKALLQKLRKAKWENLSPNNIVTEPPPQAADTKNSTQQPSQMSSVKIYNAVMAERVDNCEPVGINTEFAAGNRSLVYHARYGDGIVGQTRFVFRWYRQGAEIYEAQHMAQYTSGCVWSSCQQDFEEGQYNVKLFVDGIERNTLSFNIYKRQKKKAEPVGELAPTSTPPSAELASGEREVPPQPKFIPRLADKGKEYGGMSFAPLSISGQFKDIKAFMNSYISALSGGNIEQILELYADSVDYFGSGKVDQDFIREDKRRYYKIWAVYLYKLNGNVKLYDTKDKDVKMLSFPIRFILKNESRRITTEGHAINTLFIKNYGTEWKIIEERQYISDQKKKANG